MNHIFCSLECPERYRKNIRRGLNKLLSVAIIFLKIAIFSNMYCVPFCCFTDTIITERNKNIDKIYAGKPSDMAVFLG